ELIEHFQWLTEEQSHSLAQDKKDQVAMELADIFIYLIRIADKLGVDLVDSANKKILINESRYPIEKVRGKAGRASEFIS
ncbi:MAG: nucleotide pyrophosphohydrolase, partial [Gammaproteobacteria bacterium]|nr:nucleotide pyrophosphohydrolase [Gammaproteobacteria bacterium]